MKNSKITIYQLLVRLFGNKNTCNKPYGTKEENGTGKFNDVTSVALKEIKKLGITHIWYTGVIEHSSMDDYSHLGIGRDTPEIVKGRAGSPYAIKDYYDVHPPLAEDSSQRMNEFEGLIERTHHENLKAIIDFVPNHVAREYKSDIIKYPESDLGYTDNKEVAFAPNNNFYYLPDKKFIPPQECKDIMSNYQFTYAFSFYQEFPAKVTGNNTFSNKVSFSDWYETIKLNYGVDYLSDHTEYFYPIPDTWKKMRDILLYWTGKGIDGFRCDMAEMVPIPFWNWVIPQIKRKNPDTIFIAEVYTPTHYKEFIVEGKFDFLYDKVGLYDILRDLIEEKGSTHKITQHWQKIEEIEPHMLKFLENHDEQRIASKYFAQSPHNAFPAMVVSATLSISPVMIYFGQEVGEPAELSEGYSGNDGRTSIFDYCGVPNHQKWMNKGNFDGGLLDKYEQYTRNFYKKILNSCINYPAISKGKFYDLMWINLDNHTINTHKHFVYLRYTSHQYILIFINFDKHKSYNIILKITDEIFNHIGLETDKVFYMKDILSADNNTKFYGKSIVNNGLHLRIKENSSSMYLIK